MIRIIPIAALALLATPAVSANHCRSALYESLAGNGDCVPPPPTAPAAIVDAASTIGDAKVIEFIPATDRSRRCILVTSEFGRPSAITCWEKAR